MVCTAWPRVIFIFVVAVFASVAQQLLAFYAAVRRVAVFANLAGAVLRVRNGDAGGLRCRYRRTRVFQICQFMPLLGRVQLQRSSRGTPATHARAHTHAHNTAFMPQAIQCTWAVADVPLRRRVALTAGKTRDCIRRLIVCLQSPIRQRTIVDVDLRNPSLGHGRVHPAAGALDCFTAAFLKQSRVVPGRAGHDREDREQLVVHALDAVQEKPS